MKIDLTTIDKSQFMVHEHIVNGELVYLVQPQHIGATWTQDNKIFRSSVWNALGELVSGGFPKFVNWGEAPEVFPVPTSMKGAVCVEKVDGSLLVVSKYKGTHIFRTRGTVDASKLDNGYELEIFKQTILPKLLNLYQPVPEHDTWRHSYLFEWVSPVNKIVLNYGDQPDWFLVGIVDQTDYHLETQDFLDKLASQLGLKRPTVHLFNTPQDVLDNIKVWEGKEGVCVYTDNGQTIHKVKSDWYLVRHHMKAELSSLEKVMDFWFNEGKPDYLDLRDAIIKFDFELWAQPTTGFASKICDGYKEVKLIIEGMNRFVSPYLMVSRKLAAECILKAYGNTNRASFCFSLLDGKELDDKAIKKLMFQVLKK